MTPINLCSWPVSARDDSEIRWSADQAQATSKHGTDPFSERSRKINPSPFSLFAVPYSQMGEQQAKVERAAHDLGASDVQALIRVTVPMLWSAPLPDLPVEERVAAGDVIEVHARAGDPVLLAA